MKKTIDVKRKQYFKLNEAIFDRPVHVFLNYSHSEFVKWVRKYGVDRYKNDNEYDVNFYAFSTIIHGKNRPDEWVICMQSFDWTIKDQGSLIHEIVHTILKIWNNNNIPHTLDNQEFLAHSVGQLYEDIAAKIFRLKKIKKKS